MVHCFGWNTNFRNRNGLLLWRICSIYFIATPLLLFLCASAAELNGGASDPLTAPNERATGPATASNAAAESSAAKPNEEVNEPVATPIAGANNSSFKVFLGRATDMILILYIIGRLCTFFLVVLSFWSLPPGIYDEISLSSLIPHF